MWICAQRPALTLLFTLKTQSRKLQAQGGHLMPRERHPSLSLKHADWARWWQGKPGVPALRRLAGGLLRVQGHPVLTCAFPVSQGHIKDLPFCCIAKTADQGVEGRVYLHLWFQREKSPHGGQLWQPAADRMARKFMSSTIGTKEREQTGSREGFKLSQPGPMT